MKKILLVLVTLLFIVNASIRPKWDQGLLEDEKDLEVLKYNMVVALDGSGNFTTISKAIEAAPVLSSKRIVIKIKGGIYRENLKFPSNKTNLFLVGDGRGITVVTGTKNGRAGLSTLETATVVVESVHFLASNITFQNTAGPSNHQAVALALAGTFTAFYNCEVLGYQDTLYVMQGKHFFVKCLIEGTVDFIFGDTAQVVLQNCDIQVRIPLPGQPNVITAQGRSKNNKKGGIVIQNCRIGATHDFEGVKKRFKTYLGRPWKNYSRTIIMESNMSDIIDPAGWTEWEGTTRGLNTLFYREYNNFGPGAQTSKRVTWKGFKVVTHAVEVEPFTVRNFIDGSQWLNSTGFPYKLDL
ncbi:pectinesterase-like [Vigna radiata var. radiata]|uniref:Pectinesterase n=1 Tax=Vigna radiata var. radiata TaxID=3916 RepID=A0A1S3TPZ6_VIGRR|nr:pectinesterase-like [Vigna radiata var. radiata]